MKRVFVASDHAGVKVKEAVTKFLEDNDFNYEDFSPSNKESDDYPDFAFEVSEAVIKNKSLGILVCGSGIGMSIAANKYKGVRAALCHTPSEAKLSRSHNDANVLVLSGKTLKKNVPGIVKAFFVSDFLKGRHLRRINKIKKFELKK
ncbi:ribose 5-phosphate isomerase B [Candidatus Woesearchaeota archaeon]|nr:ribose 5-phosphate isomerase B [Candidatus Woesearchaeota archaeon]